MIKEKLKYDVQIEMNYIKDRPELLNQIDFSKVKFIQESKEDLNKESHSKESHCQFVDDLKMLY